MKRTILVLAAFTVLPGRGAAQATPDSVKHRNECRLAEQVLTTGNPAPHREWARGYIAHCGFDAWGRSTAAAVRRARFSPDLAVVRAEWDQVSSLRDANLFAAAMEIAVDRASSTPARVYSLLHLLRLAEPQNAYFYEAIVQPVQRSGPYVPRCYRGTWAGKRAVYAGTPLPSDFRAQITELTKRLSSDAAESSEVRNAASCE